MLTPADLLSWLRRPRVGRGVRLAGNRDGDWELRGYPELAATALRVAAALREDGVRPGDVVTILLPTGFDALTAFFGAWAAGASPCLLAPPSFTAEDAYLEHVGAILQQAAPRLLVTCPELGGVAAGALRVSGVDGAPWLLRKAAAPIAPHPPQGLALLQFTSGSSGTPRGTRVTWHNLAANINLIRGWTGWRDGDTTASWLPLYHDMGLIGCLLTPVASQGDLWLMRPGQFLRDPMRWLRCFGFAQHTAAPPFALEYTVRRVRPEQLAGLDLSGWRSLIVGAEAIDPAVLTRFTGLAGPAGFRPTAYRTAYGLAEATLAVTAHEGPLPPRAVRPAMPALRLGAPVLVDHEYRIGDGDAPQGSGWVTGCGRPRTGFTVSILDENGAELPPGHLGEIAVDGPCNADGYQAGREGGSTRFVGGQVRTGDAGFHHDGELFVLGRMGDSLKIRGRSVYVESLEIAVRRACGLDPGRFAVVSAPRAGTSRVVLFAELAPGDWVPRAHAELSALLGEDVAVVIVTGRRGLLPRTTSGKPRRALLATFLDRGLPGGAQVLDRQEGGVR